MTSVPRARIATDAPLGRRSSPTSTPDSRDAGSTSKRSSTASRRSRVAKPIETLWTKLPFSCQRGWRPRPTASPTAKPIAEAISATETATSSRYGVSFMSCRR
jgi:hypothetical protein